MVSRPEEVLAEGECNLEWVVKRRMMSKNFDLKTGYSNDSSYEQSTCKFPHEKKSFRILVQLCSRWGEFNIWSKTIQEAQLWGAVRSLEANA